MGSIANLKADVFVDILANFEGAVDFGTLGYNLNRDDKAVPLLYGTGPGQFDLAHFKTYTIAASGTLDLDLNGGSLKGPFGGNQDFVTVKAILFKADPTNINDIVVGNAASNGFIGPLFNTGGRATCRPGGRLLWLAPQVGWTVTAVTGDILHIINGGAGTPVSFDLALLGTSV